jgi:hypothetical protein
LSPPSTTIIKLIWRIFAPNSCALQETSAFICNASSPRCRGLHYYDFCLHLN